MNLHESTGTKPFFFQFFPFCDISRKILNIFFKIISLQSVNRIKNKRYSAFFAVNSSKQRITAVGKEYTAVDESTPFG